MDVDPEQRGSETHRDSITSASSLQMSLDGCAACNSIPKPKLILEASALDPAPDYPTELSVAISKPEQSSKLSLHREDSTSCCSSDDLVEPKNTSLDTETEPEDCVNHEQRTARILAAVEFYFSDDHVSKDAFMYRHIMRGKGGFVNMKLVASFRKVKIITKDWTVVREAVKSSTILSLNEEQTKVKRNIPFSPSINPLAKCVLVYELGPKPSMGVVEQRLEQYGRICKISIYFPGQAIPNEVRSQRHRLEIAPSEPVAVVEFSTAEEARTVVAEVSACAGKSIIRVALLNLKGGSVALTRDSGSDQDVSGTEQRRSNSASGGLGLSSLHVCKASSKRQNKKNRVNQLSLCDDSSGASDTGSEGGEATWRGNPETSDWRDEVFSPRTSPRCSPLISRRESPGLSSSQRSRKGSTPKSAPRSPRRSAERSPSGGANSTPRSPLVDVIKRQPRGPSGTGFASR